MEKRLIDADAVLEELKRMELELIYTAVVVKDAPTIDAVPVVRCKDCKGSEVFQNDSSGVMARYCKAFTLKRMVADDDYCSYGERKDDDKSCDTCKHHDKEWDDIVCDGCTKANSNWERRDDE